MRELVGREVEVITQDVVYRGILVEVGETEVHIRSESGWLAIPVANIAEVKPVE